MNGLVRRSPKYSCSLQKWDAPARIMSQGNSSGKWYTKMKDFGKQFFVPFVDIILNLWLPILTALLSLIVFNLDQTLDIYRVFALNPCPELIRIICSFISVFILSLLTWYSGRNLVQQKETREGVINSKYKNVLDFIKKSLPPLLGVVPLVALCLGLFWVKNGIGEVEGVNVNCVELNNNVGSLLNDQRWIWIALLFLLIYCCIVFVFVLREKTTQGDTDQEDTETKSLLFLGLNFLSILVVSTFTFPLVPDGGMRAIVIIFVLFLLCLILFLSKQSNSKPNSLKFFEHPLILLLLAVSALILILVAYFPYFVSNPLASQIGSVSVIALFLTVFVFWGSLLFDYGYETGIPFIIIMLILAIVFSGLDWNDNHHLRELSSSSSEQPAPVKNEQTVPVENSLEGSFNSWINSTSRQQDINKIKEFNDNTQNKGKNAQNKGKKEKYYPIYIVSAQGGGITTAYHAALTLSRLQDSFPDFASHIFAISGVSGGSFGTAVFSSLVKETSSSATKDNKQATKDNKQATKDNKQATKDNKQATKDNKQNLGALAKKAHDVLNNDFLSPLLSAGLFPDFIQRFLPAIPILSEGVDRARGLEYAFEQGWDRSQDNKDYNPQKDNPLRNSYYEHWKPDGTAPALILNTTVVETGERLVLSPFKIDLPDLKDIRTVTCEKDKIDFPLSTAAILSARFSVVTPAGWFNRCGSDGNPQKARLVDGGYFENSGITTAYEIGTKLEEIIKKDKDFFKDKKIKVIYLAFTDKPSSEIPKAGGFNEVMSPLVATWNVWQKARGLSAIAQIEYLVDVANPDPNSTNNPTEFEKEYTNHHFRQFYVHDVDPVSKKPFRNFKPPLGWFLSEYSQKFIQEQIGYQIDDKKPKDCLDDLKNGSHNACVFRSIKDELTL